MKTNIVSRTFLAVSALHALAGCAGTVVAPAGSTVRPLTLTEADVSSAQLRGELGCSFTTPDAGLLLVALGVVASPEPAQGVIKVSGAVERVTSPGGFDAMLDGGSFIGSSSSVRVDVTGPATAGGEAPPSPATLTFAAPGAAPQVVAGSWTCGP